MTRLVFINGISTHGEGNVDILRAHMKDMGYKTLDVWLPKRNVLTARWTGKTDANIILQVTNEDDILIAHSFGCLRSAYAMEQRVYKAVFMIAPAMAKDWKFGFEQLVYCFYSKRDSAITAGWALRFNHPFGAAGNTGFVNVPTGMQFETDYDHNGYFEHGIDFTKRRIDHEIKMLGITP